MQIWIQPREKGLEPRYADQPINLISSRRAEVRRKLCFSTYRFKQSAAKPHRSLRITFLRKIQIKQDKIEGFAYLSEAYLATDPNFTGRITVPVLWDKKEKRIVNNSEDDICQMWAGVFKPLAKHPVDLFPEDLKAVQDELSQQIYEDVNNGVYEAGFASSQAAYEDAFGKLFDRLDRLEAHLAENAPYLFGERIVETDYRLFCTLVRFDVVYFGHFKCNKNRIEDYPHLQGYLERIYRLPSIAETVNFDNIKRHYYYTHDDINPTRIVPVGPRLGWA
jgi:putative glutathione S-transferase